MAIYLEHLRLSAWPFSIVPRQEYCDFLGGRPQLRDDIARLLSGLSRRDTSSIHVLWSWFGAGKTHSLYYMANQASALSDVGGTALHPIYTEFPKRARGFFDLYQSAMLALDSQLLVDAFMEATTSPNWAPKSTVLSDANPDLAAAFRNLVIGNPADRSTAIRWLRGDPLAIGDFRRLGISQRLSTADQAVRVLADITQICDIAARSKGRQAFRLIWILDEFQRLERATPSVRREINAGLHSLFNTCPVGLTLVLSFSGPPDSRHLPDWISPELRDRIGATKVMILPPFQMEEAMFFIGEVLAHFRAQGVDAGDAYFPFTKDACKFVVEHLAKQSDLRPRVLMHAMNAVLDAADSLIESGNLAKIDRAFAEQALAEYVIVSDAEPDGD